MKTTKKIALSAALFSLILSGAPAQAQQKPALKDEDVFAALYQRFQTALGVDVKKAGQPGRGTLILLRPGKALDFTPEDVDSDLVVKEEMSTLLNTLPSASFFWEGTSNNLEDVWGGIIQFKETPHTTLTDAEKATLKKAQDFLDGLAEPADPNAPSETRQERYFRYRVLFEEADDTFQNDKQEAVISKRAPKSSLKTAVEKASSDLTNPSKGNKNDVLANMEKVAELSGRDPLVFWNKLRTDWDTTFAIKGISGKTFHDIRTIPSIKSWKQNAGWTKIVIDSSKENFSQSESAFKAGGKVSGAVKLLRFSASGDYSKDTSSVENTSSSIKIEAEIKRVMIYRPWLNSVVFNAKFWRIGNNPLAQPFLNISAGRGIDGQAHPGEMMPMLPVEVLLARNVKIAADFSEDTVKKSNSNMSANGSASYGPFALTAHAKSSKSKLDKTAKVDKAGISFDDIQIIGVYVDVLGKVPNPDLILFK